MGNERLDSGPEARAGLSSEPGDGALVVGVAPASVVGAEPLVTGVGGPAGSGAEVQAELPSSTATVAVRQSAPEITRKE